MDNTFPVVVEVDGITHHFTEFSIKELIQERSSADRLRKEIQTIRNTVRDFFSEGDWSSGEQTINKGDVNELLDSIGCAKILTKYQGTFTITGTFTVEAEDESEAENQFIDNANVEFWDGDIDVDNTEVNDVEESY